MVKRVKDEHGLIHSFPDDTTEDEMNSAFSQWDKEKKQRENEQLNYYSGLKRTPVDTARDLAQGALTGLGKGGQFLGESMEKIPGFQALQQKVQGATGISVPRVNMDEAFSGIGSPNKSIRGEIAKTSGSYMPYGMAGGPSMIGQMLAGGTYGAATTEPEEKNFLDILPRGKAGGAIEDAALATLPTVAKLGWRLGKKVLGTKNPLLAAQEEMLQNKIGNITQESEQTAQRADKAAQEHAMQLEAHNKAVEEAKTNVNMADASRMKYKIDTQNRALEENKKAVEDLDNKIKEYPEPPAPPEEAPQRTEHIDRLNDANNEISRTQENVESAKNNHEKSLNSSQEAEKNISEHLNEGANHPMRAAREMKHDINSINNYWSNEYKDLMHDLKKTKFELMNPDRESKINSIIEKFSEMEDPTGEISKILKQSPKFSDKSAHDFMAKLKDLRNSRYDLLQRARLEPNNEIRKEMFKAYDQTKDLYDVVSDTLSEGLGEHGPRYRYINEGYKNQIFPLRENDIAEKIISGKPLSENIAKELSGDQIGQELLREIAKRNPETLRNIAGQRYTAKPESIHNPKELLREYTNEMPDLQKLVNSKKQAEEISNKAKEHLDIANEQHNNAKNELSNAEKFHKKIESDISKLDKDQQKKTRDYEKNLTAHEKNKSELQTKLKNLNNQNKIKEQEIAKLEREMGKVKQEADKKNITLKNKLSAEREFKNKQRSLKLAKKELSDIKNQVDKTTSGLKKVMLVAKTLYKIGRKFT